MTSETTSSDGPILVRRAAIDTLADLALDACEGVFRAAHSQNTVHVILAGGTSPRRLYERWAEIPDIDWASVSFYFGDERCVPPGSPASNSRMFELAFLQNLRTTSSPTVHRIEGERSPDDAADRYNRLLASIDSFDLAILGIGSDGHTASLFPGDVAPEGRDAFVVQRPDFIRVSLSPSVFARCHHLLFFAPGESKHAVVDDVVASSTLPAGTVSRLASSTIFASSLA